MENGQQKQKQKQNAILLSHIIIMKIINKTKKKILDQIHKQTDDKKKSLSLFYANLFNEKKTKTHFTVSPINFITSNLFIYLFITL